MVYMKKIPKPKTFGPLGNIPLIDKEKPVQSFCKLADEYGPIFEFEFPRTTNTFVSNHQLVADVCDPSRFDKHLSSPLKKVRAFAGDGLFTSETQEPNWQKAHNILLPSFSQQAMTGYYPMMLDLALQLVQKWERLNPNESIDVPKDMTNLTLDTIGLCGFNYRFNSFYREKPHPFITSMFRALNESMNQTQRLGLQDKLMVLTKNQYKHDINVMFSLVDKIVSERKENGHQGEDDLLSLMLNAKDPQTGEKLDDINIRYQMITFLIAGHETTSGLLSFALYYLLKNPDKLKKAYEEVDTVLTDPIPSYKQVKNLKYLKMILNESLRLWPTAPAFSLYAKEDTVIGGEYLIEKGRSVAVLIPKLHRDKDAWGDDVEAFRPERFEDPSKIPHHAYKPFGNGQRACIGMQFALQEATLILGMVLQHFELIDHTDYELNVKETLTLKPDNFTIRVKSRKKQVALAVSSQETAPAEEKKSKSEFTQAVDGHNTPLLVLYGSNLGTAEGIARELAETARYQGFQSKVAALDEYIGKLPKEGAVLIITSSYNGKAPDNAAGFVEWIGQVEAGEFRGVKYAVFGCGNRNWASTYQRIPQLIDEQIAVKGAKRIVPIGEGDANDDFEAQLDHWHDRLWTDLMKEFNLKETEQREKGESTLTVEFVNGPISTSLVATYDAFSAQVKENRELQTEKSERSTRHIEILLPEGAAYHEGDHLGVLPQNREELVERVLDRYRLTRNDHIILNGSGRNVSHLPLGYPVSVYDLLTCNVELLEAATRAQLRELASFTVCPPHKRELEALLEGEEYKKKVLQKRLTMLDLLEQYPACELPFDRFIELLPSLKARYYSISSSPKMFSESLSITVGVVCERAWNGRGEYKGVASNYLADRKIGDNITCFIRTPQSGFQLPENPETPVIMVGPGTGIAPFRGFLQARRIQKEEGKKLAEAHLYFGCRNSEQDYLYRQELEQVEQDGLVTLHTAFSRLNGQPKTYVQHLMKRDAAALIHLLDDGAHLYICGDGSKMAPDVEATLCHAYQEVHRVGGQEAENWLEQLQSEGRYAKDVWTGI
ncbi:NADPH--cytochrome reductase [Domibacillus aminovorans]|uniref:Bifunctional cytochrome P450/NADPH--P450 reductase n=1 Tax=Domibacillus aminovorans TaxID=29332 RepID=A0A177KRP7_9BACI|nr:NADPH--cytochrome reductase [Domibacillus aminovorans]